MRGRVYTSAEMPVFNSRLRNPKNTRLDVQSTSEDDRRDVFAVTLNFVWRFFAASFGGRGQSCYWSIGLVQAAQQESLLTSVVKDWAAILMPSAMVR